MDGDLQFAKFPVPITENGGQYCFSLHSLPSAMDAILYACYLEYISTEYMLLLHLLVILDLDSGLRSSI